MLITINISLRSSRAVKAVTVVVEPVPTYLTRSNMARDTDTGFSRKLRQWRRSNQLSADARAGAYSRRQLELTQLKWLRTNRRAAASLLGGCVALAVVAQVVAANRFSPYVVGAVLASGPWLLYTIMLETDGGHTDRSGVMGEELTARQLRGLTGGWRMVNHIMLENADVDHAALGPGGFLAVETKYRSDWKAGSPYFDGIAAQARRSALGLRGRLGRTSHIVQPVVAMWGPGLLDAFPDVFTHANVTFCPGPLLRQHLASLPELVAAADVQTAFDGLDHYIERRDQGELKDAGPYRSLNDRVNDAGAISIAVTLSLMSVLFAPGGIIGKAVAAVAVIAVAIWFRVRGPRSYRPRLVALAVIIAAVALAIAVPALALVISLRR